MKSKLTLVGAGPGDKDLITLKGIRALQEAKVVLYDALVDEEILEFAKLAIKVYVGKRGGEKSFTQERINQLIVSNALIYGKVVRLKGGDPFIFGRGLEEIEFAKRNGIDTEVVPGISSSTGITALHNISLTQRGIANGFWVLTASKKGNLFNEDLRLAAKSNSTIVVLMGVQKLSLIVREFKKSGKENLPVIIIQNGSLPNEKIVRGEVNSIEKLALENKVGAPAIIVLGETARDKNVVELKVELFNQLN